MTMRSQVTAARIRGSAPRADLLCFRAPDGGASGTIDSPIGADSFTLTLPRHQLASRHRPLEEARVLAGTIDATKTAAVVVMGFGLGHHVKVLSESLREHGIVIVFEPDVALLRAVLERVDHSSWLARGNVVVLTDPNDQPAITSALKRCETLLSLGTQILAHPPSAARLGRDAAQFGAVFAEVMRAVRTTVVTTLVQSETTLRNLLQNTDYYVSAPGIADLAGRCRGRAAIVVSAGPSLARNIELLSQPDVRDKFVIIAVQTVLKQLLARGIKPHFVTALDHHEISRRFYEGLTADDVRGITLIAEPKANPAILDAFPGSIRCCGDEILDEIVGASLAREHGRIQPGATVAHLAYYVARHLACDPVILVGQDLAFTDGQYYAEGAAIHNVWSSELSEFRTLEMFEWERIVRMKGQLKRATDHLGRPIYSDEQMATYLVQFERDFAADAQRGLTTIDATEGGVAKRSTRAMPLADALKQWGSAPAGAVPFEPDPLAAISRARRDAKTVEKAEDRLRRVRGDLGVYASKSRETRALLDQMIDAGGNAGRINALIAKVHAIRDEVTSMRTASWLVHFVNQTGSLRRVREDRAIELDATLSPLEKQRRQIMRDRDNVSWLADAAEHAATLLDDAINALGGAPKVTRDTDAAPAADSGSGESARMSRRRVIAVIAAMSGVSSLGVPRDLHATFALDRSILETTLTRLALASEIDAIAILSDDVAGVERAIDRIKLTKPVHVLPLEAGAMRRHVAACRGARAWCRSAWRGGLANLAGVDEVLAPHVIAPALDSIRFDAIVPIGPDWVFVDPSLLDATIARHRESPERTRLAFSQAPVGLSSCVIDRTLLEELARSPSPFSSIGGLLGYIPVAPQMDPIAKPACVTIDPLIRDAGVRFVADSHRARAALGALAGALGERGRGASAKTIAEAVGAHAAAFAAHPDVMHFSFLSPEGRIPSAALEQSLIAALAANPGAALTIELANAASSSSISHEVIARVGSLVEKARRAHAAVHIRASLDLSDADANALWSVAPDVLSFDVPCPNTPGAAATDRILANANRLLESRERDEGPGLPTIWLVPRMTRRDAAYEHLEPFYDQALMRFGAAVIDPLPAPIPGDRIAPLPLPAAARARFDRTHIRINADGAVYSHAGARIGDLSRESLDAIWSRHVASLGVPRGARA